MKTFSLSTRMSQVEAETIDIMAERAGLERSAFLKQRIRKGMHEMALEQAVATYRSGAASLSKGAEMAGLPYRDFLVRMQDAVLELNYRLDALAMDLKEA